MAMTIGEASAVARVLHVLARDYRALTNTPTQGGLRADLELLNQRAAKALQLSYITGEHALDVAAVELLQRLEDAA